MRGKKLIFVSLYVDLTVVEQIKHFVNALISAGHILTFLDFPLVGGSGAC